MPRTAPRVRLRATREPLLYGGVALTFAPIGVLVAMVNPEPGGWAFALAVAIFSAVLAMGWAFAVSTRRWWLLLPLNVIPFVAPAHLFGSLDRLGVLDAGYGYDRPTRLVILAVMVVVLTSAGFVLTILHIRRNERRGERIRVEFEMAARVHRDLVPAVDLRDGPAEVLAVSVPSAEMGGDLVDVVPGATHTDVVLADVSGHGVHAGIAMALLKGAIRAELRRGPGLGELAQALNAVLEGSLRPGMFATFAAVRVHADRRVEHVLAGHPPIFVIGRDGAVRDLENAHLPLGVSATERMTEGVWTARPGDLLVLYTDGLTEVTGPGGRQLGIGGLRAIVAARAGEPLAALRDAVFDAVRAHGPQLDDQTLVLVRLR